MSLVVTKSDYISVEVSLLFFNSPSSGRKTAKNLEPRNFPPAYLFSLGLRDFSTSTLTYLCSFSKQ